MKKLMLEISLLFMIAISVQVTNAQTEDTSKLYIYPTILYPGDNYMRLTCHNGIKNINHTTTNEKVYVDRFGEQSCEKYIDFHINISHKEKVSLWLIITDCTGREHKKLLESKYGRKITVTEFDSIKIGELVNKNIQLKYDEFKNVIVQNTGVCRIKNCNVNASAIDNIYYPFSITNESNFEYQITFKADSAGVYRIPVTHTFQKEDYLFNNDKYAITDTVIFRVLEDKINDPTTYRTVVFPNAYIPKGGTVFVGAYDVFGIAAGVSLNDNVMLLVGGIIPTPDDWAKVNGDYLMAYSGGIKSSINLNDKLIIGGGYQFAKSIYDKQETLQNESEIISHIPYLAISYGGVSSRVSLTTGYQFKHHKTIEEEFSAQSIFGALGADYEFLNRWKVATELCYFQSISAVPINLVVRYFGKNYGIDLGFSYQGLSSIGSKPNNDLIPIISFNYLFQ